LEFEKIVGVDIQRKIFEEEVYGIFRLEDSLFKFSLQVIEFWFSSLVNFQKKDGLRDNIS
jgi:hypothetical protein